MTTFGLGIFLFKIMENIPYAQAVTADLIRIGRADAFAGRADLSGTFGRFVGTIKGYDASA